VGHNGESRRTICRTRRTPARRPDRRARARHAEHTRTGRMRSSCCCRRPGATPAWRSIARHRSPAAVR